MIVNVWLVYKRGEPRVYTWTFLPAEDQVAIFRKDGFKIFRAEVDLPVDDETIVIEADAREAPLVTKPVFVPGPEPEQKRIYCPQCNTRHYDEYDPDTEINWATRPHRKHLCAKCKHVWQEAEHFTVGV